MMSIHGNNSGGSQSSSGHTPNHNCDSNLSTASAGSHNSDKDMDNTPEKCRNQSSGGSSGPMSAGGAQQPQTIDRKRRKKASDGTPAEQQPNGPLIVTN
jgi:hypothetical protein